jgi:hypothetical protein
MMNPNMLYFQTTPMTELPLILFFSLSTYYFLKYIFDNEKLLDLILAGLFGFCATLTRYDGWFLVALQAGLLALRYFPWRRIPRSWAEFRNGFRTNQWATLEGKLLVFATLAFFGIGLWFLWDLLILGDPFYFTNSEFSAKSQQNAFLAGGVLPAYHSFSNAIIYYLVTAMSATGVVVFTVSAFGFTKYILSKSRERFPVGLLLGIIFIFNVFTMFVGQSVIFIPSLTPPSFGNNLFNVRYGLLMVPFTAIFFAYLFAKLRTPGRTVLCTLLLVQLGLYGVGYSKIITLEDGRVGVSSAERPEAERWMKKNYDGGLVLLDDYARTISVVRSGIPMQKMIYVGNKPYWLESLDEPEKHARWIALRENDAVWKGIFTRPEVLERLHKHFELVYTEKEIRIFKLKGDIDAESN